MSAKLDVRGRRKARRALVQALYQWQMNEASAAHLVAEFSTGGALKGADRPFFNQVLETALARTEELDGLFESVLDRAGKGSMAWSSPSCGWASANSCAGRTCRSPW